MKFAKIIKKLGSGKPLLAVLIDPDKFNPGLIQLAAECNIHCLLVGGSELMNGDVTRTIRAIKKITQIPVVLFPGDERQLSSQADGLLLLSLLSGRNPDYLIEKHIAAAPVIKKMKLPFISTAYLLIDGGRKSATQSVTNTIPLDPRNETYIVNTTIAASQLGFKAIYLEAGSGAATAISSGLVKKAKKQSGLPVIVGGGIDSVKKVKRLLEAGADMIVIGNALEKDPLLLREISKCF